MYGNSELLMFATYFAPRGKARLLHLGNAIAQKHLDPYDRLIGMVGDSGSGKSLLVKGMFPGLDLTNDDEGIHVRPLPILDEFEEGTFKRHTYHLDIRLELGFNQPWVLAEAVSAAVMQGKRVVVEHFELICDLMGRNADILIGIGEEVIVTRPNAFGPLPKDISEVVYKSIGYRKKAHTAEDITCNLLKKEYGIKSIKSHGEVRHGFILKFDNDPRLDVQRLDREVNDIINQHLQVAYMSEESICIGDEIIRCTGPRIHVSNTRYIDFFKFLPEVKFDAVLEKYNLVGLVSKDKLDEVNDINKLNFW